MATEGVVVAVIVGWDDVRGLVPNEVGTLELNEKGD
jgi:hypothetical protein